MLAKFINIETIITSLTTQIAVTERRRNEREVVRTTTSPMLTYKRNKGRLLLLLLISFQHVLTMLHTLWARLNGIVKNIFRHCRWC